jgi:hypothetical protein
MSRNTRHADSVRTISKANPNGRIWLKFVRLGVPVPVVVSLTVKQPV